MATHPFIEVTANGEPVNGAFYDALVEATISDAPGQDNDRLDVTFDDDHMQLPAPSKGDILVVRFGFRGSGRVKMGVFEVDATKEEFGPPGQFLIVSAHGADMRKDLKEPGCEHFDDMTLGDIVRETARGVGMDAIVSRELDEIEIDYEARWEQSRADFLTRLADRHGGVYAVKDGKVAMLRRDGEDDLETPEIVITKSDCESGTLGTDPRADYGGTSGKWFDRSKAELVYEDEDTEAEGPRRRLRHPFRNQDQAKRAANAEAKRLNRKTGSGSLMMSGRPEIRALSRLWLTGFRPENNGSWRAGEVEHTFSETYMTGVQLEAGQEGRR